MPHSDELPASLIDRRARSRELDRPRDPQAWISAGADRARDEPIDWSLRGLTREEELIAEGVVNAPPRAAKGSRGPRRSPSPEACIEVHPLQRELGRRLATLRDRRVLSHHTVAQRMVDVARSSGRRTKTRAVADETVARWEAGDAKISRENLSLFCRALHVDPHTEQKLARLHKAIPTGGYPDEALGPIAPTETVRAMRARIAGLEVNARQRIEAREFLMAELGEGRPVLV